MHDSDPKKPILIKAALLYIVVVAGTIACLFTNHAGYTPIVLLAGAFIGSMIKILPDKRFATVALSRTLVESVAVTILVLVPYTALLFGMRHYGYLSFAPGVPADQNFMKLILIHIVAIAIPEEYFFRGTLQPAFDRVWPPHWRFMRISFGPSLFLTSLLFGIAHVFRQGPIGLSTAIPSLAFGMFYYRHKNIVGAVIFHAACNLLMVFLKVDYSQLLRYVQQ